MIYEMPIEVKLTLSKLFPSGMSEIRFGRYRIQPVPLSNMTKGEAILSFIDTYEDSLAIASNPDEEANIICRLLSVFFDARISKTGLRVNSIDIPVEERRERELYPQFFGFVDPSPVDAYLRRVLSLDENLARQFIRAAHTYSFALEFIPSDPTFAFFLLVVAGECMSSQDKVIPLAKSESNSQTCERFCNFIKTYLAEDFKGGDERNNDLFNELLKTIYYSHRSGFVHGGKEVSGAAILADKVGSSYFKHSPEGKEIKTPGLGWFARIVRGALLGYLISLQSPTDDSLDEQLVPRLALEKGLLNLKVKTDIKKGQIVTSNNIEFR